ncbi:MAG: JDVT-CTERM system glutamic-type intramembrane protease [Salinisphaeraceae bacterium]|nr:JDVT-CTERM system glutamic-type intramembrane protease [Salinisphaeraceae bacterium]
MNNRWRDWQWWLALGAGPLFCLVLIVAGLDVVGPDWIAGAILTFLLLALVYPVLEEIVFRGLIQDSLSERLTIWRFQLISKANLLTSLAFTALHFFSHPPLWAASVFLPSLLFGYFRERHNSLVSPITLHAFYNSVYFALFGIA